MSDEAVDFDGTVETIGQVEGHATDGRCCNGRKGIAICGKRGYAAIETEPHHDFKCVASRGRGADEGVVSHCHNIRSGSRTEIDEPHSYRCKQDYFQCSSNATSSPCRCRCSTASVRC